MKKRPTRWTLFNETMEMNFFFFLGVLLCVLYCGVCFLFFLEKVICVDQRTIRTIRSNSKPQILKADSRLYPFSFLATVVSDENEFYLDDI